MATIRQSVEGKRGCGYRRKGLYLRLDGAGSQACGKIPYELKVCPCCGEGISHTKGWRWITSELFKDEACAYSLTGKCNTCPMGSIEPYTKLGLLWVGKEHYPTPYHFIREAESMGISKRIGAVPRNFKVGETWIAMAHIEAVKKDEEDSDEAKYVPGVFMVFKPSRIEYVVGGDETEEELDALEERGFELVQVIVRGDVGDGDDEECDDEEEFLGR